MNIRSRVDEACIRSGKKMADLARIIGLTSQALGKSLDKDQATYKRLDDIALALDVPADWLRHGGPDPWELDPMNAKLKEMQDQVLLLRNLYIKLAANHLDLVNDCHIKGVAVDERFTKELRDALAKIE